jgi:hypothetical protein
MRNGLPISLGMAILLFTMTAHADPTPADLRGEPHGILSWARADYKRGKLQQCRRDLESTLTALCGHPKITKHPTGWPGGSGPPATVHADWRTPTTCMGLGWEDGAGRWNPSLRLTLGVNSGDCGGYDDQVVTIEQ